MTYYPGSFEFSLVDALRELLAHDAEPSGPPMGDMELWKRQEAERERINAFIDAMKNILRTENSVLQSKLQDAKNECIALQTRMTSLEAQIGVLQSKSTHFDQEQERFMKACVCVKLNQPPNRPAEGK